jgi:hypothetical protein
LGVHRGRAAFDSSKPLSERFRAGAVGVLKAGALVVGGRLFGRAAGKTAAAEAAAAEGGSVARSSAGVTRGTPEVFYRAVSRAEYEGLVKSKGLAPCGESFVTQDLEYVKQLQARHPDLYETVVRLDVQPGTAEALVKHGARGPGRLLEQQGLGDLPKSSRVKRVWFT